MKQFLSPQLNLIEILKSVIHLKDWILLRNFGLTQLGWNDSRKKKKSVDKFGPIPWWTYSCTHFLDQIINTNASIIEFGGGASTLWWLNRGNRVLTIETEQAWVSKLQYDAQLNVNKHNWRLIYAPEINPQLLKNEIGSQKFDVVVNDGFGDRSELESLLVELCKHNGIIVWDNSDRTQYKDSISNLQKTGYKKLDFFGLTPINAYCALTTVFAKNFPQPVGKNIKIQTIEY